MPTFRTKSYTFAVTYWHTGSILVTQLHVSTSYLAPVIVLLRYGILPIMRPREDCPPGEGICRDWKIFWWRGPLLLLLDKVCDNMVWWWVSQALLAGPGAASVLILVNPTPPFICLSAACCSPLFTRHNPDTVLTSHWSTRTSPGLWLAFLKYQSPIYISPPISLLAHNTILGNFIIKL